MSLTVEIIEPGYTSGDSPPSIPSPDYTVVGPVSSPTEIGPATIGTGGGVTMIATFTPESGHSSTYRCIAANPLYLPYSDPYFAFYIADTNYMMFGAFGGVRFFASDMTPGLDVSNVAVVKAKYPGGIECWLNGTKSGGSSVYYAVPTNDDEWTGTLCVAAVTEGNAQNEIQRWTFGDWVSGDQLDFTFDGTTSTYTLGSDFGAFLDSICGAGTTSRTGSGPIDIEFIGTLAEQEILTAQGGLSISNLNPTVSGSVFTPTITVISSGHAATGPINSFYGPISDLNIWNVWFTDTQAAYLTGGEVSAQQKISGTTGNWVVATGGNTLEFDISAAELEAEIETQYAEGVSVSLSGGVYTITWDDPGHRDALDAYDTDLFTDLVIFWKLNEASGTRVDSIGSNDLTPHNSIGSTTGVVGDCAEFVRASSTYLSSASTSDLILNGSNWTISFWLYLTDNVAEIQGVFSKWTSDYFCYYNHPSVAADEVAFGVAAGGTVYSGVVSINDWHHYVIRFNSSNTGSELEMFVDNVLTDTASSTNAPSGADGFNLGVDQAGNYLEGLIDSFGIWKRAIGDAEVEILYNAGEGLEPPFEVFALIAHYDCEEGSGSTLTDIVGDKDATIDGSTYSTTVPPINGGTYSLESEDVGNGATTDEPVFTNIDNFTMACWYYPGVLSQNALILQNGDTAGIGLWQGNAGSPSANLEAHLPGVIWRVSPYEFPAAEEWYHLILMSDSGTLRFFVDGTEVWSVSQSVATPVNGTYMGGHVGLIDDIRFYNYVLDSEEIDEISDTPGSEVEAEADATCVTTVSGTIKVARAVAAAPSAVTTVSGTIKVARAVAATPSAVTTVSGAVNVAKAVSSAVSGVCTMSAAATVAKSVAAAITSVCSMTARFGLLYYAESNVAAETTVSATADVTHVGRPIAGSEIVYVLSGGVSNNSPNLSLGGDPSSTAIAGRTLFDNISEQEAKDGSTDYRCFYVFNNNSDTGTLYDAKVFLVQVDDGADATIGLLVQNEVQELSIVGTFDSGTFDIQVTPSGVNASPIVVTVTLDADPSNFAQNLEDAINNAGINSVVVNANNVVQSLGVYSQIVFQISWQDDEQNRYQESLVVTDNNLATTASLSVGKILNGSPINIIADELDSELIAPNGIDFVEADENSKISLGDLRPLDGFPVWIQRVVATGATALEGDGFIFRLQGYPIAVD